MDLSPAIEALGSEVRVACPVLSRGQLKQRAAIGAIGGVAGLAVARMLKKDKTDDTAPGGHTGSIVIALGTDRIAFFEQKNGLTASLGKHLGTHDLTTITNVDWQPARFGVSKLTLAAGDETYEFEVALVQKRKAQRIVDAVHERGLAA